MYLRCTPELVSQDLSDAKQARFINVNGKPLHHAMDKVNIAEKFSKFQDQWNPKIVGELNGQEIRLARVKGDFIWHKHDDADEFFLVVEGQLTIDLRDREIVLDEGEFFIVPRGVEHKPFADHETLIMMFEPADTANTGDIDSDRTLKKLERI